MSEQVKPVTKEDFIIINEQEDLILAEWWCQLNRWDWPEKLPNPESDNYIPNGRRSKIMDIIDDKISHRLISRTWNKKMSDTEFEDFYAGVFENDSAARARYDKWLNEKHQH